MTSGVSGSSTWEGCRGLEFVNGLGSG